MMDINEKLRALMEQRQWTEYRLALNSGLSQSTIANIFRRNTVPSCATLEEICKAFGITLTQFFAENELVELTSEQRAMFEQWKTLTPMQKDVVMQLIKVMNDGAEVKK